MPHTRIIIHAVWSTKCRRPLMSKENKDSLCHHIRANARKNGVSLINVNGWLDHLHALLCLKPVQPLDDVMRLLKGESSFWARRNLAWPEEFEWQDDYWAASVSPRYVDRVDGYIDRQEIHHRRRSFEEEFTAFAAVWGE